MKLVFGDIVVVDKMFIGVVVKCWGKSLKGEEPNYDIYVRSYNAIKNYKESEVQSYMVRHKELNKEELMYQQNALSAR